MQATTKTAALAILFLTALVAPAAEAAQLFSGPRLAGVPVEFFLFGATLAGVALFHKHTLQIAVAGLAIVALYKLGFSPFHEGSGLGGLFGHLLHEWVILVNLLLLMLGFALLASHFEQSMVPAILPRFLPAGWLGGFVLLTIVFVISSILDNIAAAMIGGAIAAVVFRGKVHIGYLAGIVAASNAGGAGSVVGDTTTTMMWIAGVHPLEVLEGYIGSAAALLIFGFIAARQQHALQPLQRDVNPDDRVDWGRLTVVAAILMGAMITNVVVNTRFAELSDAFPFLGAAVWVVLLATAGWRTPQWHVLPGALRGSIFLLSLVLAASMMPVEELPHASWQTAIGLGFVSAVFDNIPLTELALKQGGFDWGFLAYAVGFGGSMLWFGSSAGVALSSMFPQARSAAQWLRHGWHVALAYVVGFFVMLSVIGFEPGTQPRTAVGAGPASTAPAR
jgi:Na+/H+ antiporter NhaD/arsenite permease-like protein